MFIFSADLVRQNKIEYQDLKTPPYNNAQYNIWYYTY
jgi:hypothetical protein